MSILSRVEMLEAAVRRTNDVGYKVVFLQEGENYEEHLVQEGLSDWPSDRILTVWFIGDKNS
jgi:hypothetical protein